MGEVDGHQWRFPIFNGKYECKVRLYKTCKAMMAGYLELTEEKGCLQETKERLSGLTYDKKPAAITLRMDDKNIYILFSRPHLYLNLIAHECVHVISNFIEDENIEGLNLSDDEEIVADEIGLLLQNIYYNCGKYIKHKIKKDTKWKNGL